MIRSTYTVVELEVPAEFYALVRDRLLAAGYTHAIDDDERTLDMRGIALTHADLGDPVEGSRESSAETLAELIEEVERVTSSSDYHLDDQAMFTLDSAVETAKHETLKRNSRQVAP